MSITTQPGEPHDDPREVTKACQRRRRGHNNTVVKVPTSVNPRVR